MEFRFAAPLFWLAVLPLVAVTLWCVRRQPRTMLYSSSRLLSDLPITIVQRLNRSLPWIRMASWILIAAALARPQSGQREYRLETEGIAIMSAIDRSGSMLALDFEIESERVDRLAAVKHVLRNFVTGGADLPGRPFDLIGLVTFGGYAEGRVPLTLDHLALINELDKVEVAQPIYDDDGRVLNASFLQEEQATAIGDAVALSVERLRENNAKSKIVILLSDGESTAGLLSPEDAAVLAAKFDIKVYSIGIGTTGRAPFPVQDAFGQVAYTTRSVKLDEASLKQLSERTGGQYFNARDTQTLADVYAEIDQLEKSLAEGQVYIDYEELFPWVLVPGLTLLMLEIVLRATWLRSWP
jgi:Ca-activated chloride channel family protein